MVFILVPADGTADQRYTIRAAQQACRVAHLTGLTPFSPLLHYSGYLSPGELTQELAKLSWRWLKLCDKIWLQFAHGEDNEELDSLCYDILEHNRRLGPRLNTGYGRRPVYQLHPTGEEKVGFVPVPMSKDEVGELLAINLVAGLASRCM
jgi:hypothetical protein